MADNTLKPISMDNVTPLTLPDWCYAVLPSSGALIVVERDVRGYGKLSNSTDDRQQNRRLAREYNSRMGITPQQEAAMLGGSMFGWDTPAAKVSCYDEQGEALLPLQLAKTADQSAENRFLGSASDAYAIYQLKQTDQTRDLRFEPLVRLQLEGKAVDRTNYECVYTAALHEKTLVFNLLHELYEQFNLDHPADFTGHSLSISDVVALKQDGQVSCHYVDRWGFAELPTFLQPENPLKNAEMAMEDDYGMIDGIINNGKAPAIAKEQEKPSVLAQLKPKQQEQKHKAPHHNVERGMER